MANSKLSTNSYSKTISSHSSNNELSMSSSHSSRNGTKNTVINDHIPLVFNAFGCILFAILRLHNSSTYSDIFYKLFPDSNRLAFRVNSWRGKIRRNSYADIMIVFKPHNNCPNGGEANGNRNNKDLILAQLCQTKFTLEMAKYKWRHRFPYSCDGQCYSNNNDDLTKSFKHCKYFRKIEIYCFTSESSVAKLNNDNFNHFSTNENMTIALSTATTISNSSLIDNELTMNNEIDEEINSQNVIEYQDEHKYYPISVSIISNNEPILASDNHQNNYYKEDTLESMTTVALLEQRPTTVMTNNNETENSYDRHLMVIDVTWFTMLVIDLFGKFFRLILLAITLFDYKQMFLNWIEKFSIQRVFLFHVKNKKKKTKRTLEVAANQL